ncbi:MAG: ribonuclease HII [Pseudomonadota bacterium]
MANSNLICGIDEAGRGPWAGPVIAAAVILGPKGGIPGVADSKTLSRQRRETLFDQILARAQVGIGEATVAEIDRLNVLNASLLAMARALADLPVAPQAALIDGNRLPPDLPCPAEAVVKGDAKVPAIAAASIVAKVTRDRIMVALSQQYPGYGWERNAGYGVKTHAEALKSLGITPHHRRSFKPIHNMLYEN